MSKPSIDEILAPKPDDRLQIYAWSPNDPPADYVDLIKVGQTTHQDVNARIRQSQGQMQQAYTLHFAAHQLAKKLGATRVLVVTFKPAVEDAWQTDLDSHVDFDGWQYLSRSSGSDPTQIDRKKPVVYFGSFQDLLGRDSAGNIKAKNEWIHKVKWDL